MNYIDLNTEFSYIIKNEVDRSYGMTINTVGFQSVNPNSPYPARIHPKGYYFNSEKGRILNEYQFIYITKGEGELILESLEKIPITEGKFVIIFPGQWHSYHPYLDIGWNEYYIGFEGKIIERLIANSFFIKNNQVLNVGLNEELVNLFIRALETAKADKIAAQQNLLGILMHMIGLVLFESKNFDQNNFYVKQIVENAKIILNENIYNNIYPEVLAVKLGLNYTSFRKLFKNNTGFAPAQYLQILRIKKAKQLLLESTLSIKEISNKLKYYSPESFNITFKKNVGVTPSKYRSKCI